MVTRELVLRQLKKADTYISGEDISALLGITRSAVWKCMQELREDGYEISAVPHLGYKLESSPNKLLPEEVRCGLNTKVIGRQVLFLESVPSTMDVIFQEGVRGAREGLVVYANSQTKGKGRLGRNWASPREKGIYLSILLRPKMLPADALYMTLLAAVGTCEAVRKVTNLNSFIKWPNDILVNDRKVSGILLEMSAETDRVNFLIIGIGINVNTNKSQLPPNATSLRAELSKEVNISDLLKEVLSSIESRYFLFKEKGIDPILERWRFLSYTIGRRVKIANTGGCIEGVALDIGPCGELIVRRDSGFVEHVFSGDATVLK